MSLIKKFWLLWFFEKQQASMSRTLSGFLSHMAAIASLFVFCAQLLLLFLLSLLWLAYIVLTGYGFTAGQAGLTLAAVVLALLAAGVLTVRRAFHDMQDTLDYELRRKPSLSHAVSRITDSFVDGLLREQRP